MYKKLLKIKRDKESFSDVIERLLQNDLMSFAGIFAYDENFAEITNDIKTVRKTTRLQKLNQ